MFKKNWLDLHTIGQEELISDEAWYDEELLSDIEIQKKKDEIVEKTKARGEVEGVYFIKPIRSNHQSRQTPTASDWILCDEWIR